MALKVISRRIHMCQTWDVSERLGRMSAPGFAIYGLRNRIGYQ
jgi:hypothetical protein